MKYDLKNIFVILMILSLLGETETSAQNIDAFARVSVAPREGVVRQPYKVTITVHSSTWFARPLQFANLHIDDAFIIPFTRTVSSINYINKKKYATLSFYYLVFPYNTGNIEIPELSISTSIPPEGDSKGEPVTIKTKPQIIKVKTIPSSKDENVWMVAKNVTIKENWSKPLDNLKVGDVIEREITVTINGTLPSLIQPLELEKPESTSIYPKEPVLQDKRNNNDANGIRIEKYSYLFEEETEITIPEEEILWWNPETKRVYKRTLPKKIISIAANPDLGMMESLKDSLLAINSSSEIQVEEKTIPWLRFGFIAFMLLFVAYFGTKTIRWILEIRKKKQEIYLQSEAYYFKKLMNALNNKNTSDFIRELYCWFDWARNISQEAAIFYYLNSEEQELLEQIIQKSNSDNNIEISSLQKQKLTVLLQNLRKQILQSELRKNIEMKLNPI